MQSNTFMLRKLTKGVLFGRFVSKHTAHPTMAQDVNLPQVRFSPDPCDLGVTGVLLSESTEQQAALLWPLEEIFSILLLFWHFNQMVHLEK